MGRGSSSSSSSLLFRTLVVLGIILVISTGILQISEGHETNKTRKITSDDRQSRASEKLQQQQVMKVFGKVKSSESDLNYMSKRRVPNGPDPIHNRRAGNSGRPPGRA